MNTVVSNPTSREFGTTLLKHVIMEKFVYDCAEDPGSDQERRFIRDQEIFIEIVQRVQAGRTTTVEKRVEEAVCNKSLRTLQPGNFESLRIDCSTRDVPVPEIPSGADATCRAFGPGELSQPTDPVEMNTVITARQDTIVTMKVEKELIECFSDGGPGVAHLFLFTEIVEQRAGPSGADNIRPTQKKFQAILCLGSDFAGRIEECGHFVPAASPPA